MYEFEQIENVMVVNNRRFFNLAFSITHNAFDAEDAVGNALEKAFNNYEKIRKLENIDRWLYKIVMNESRNIVNKHKKYAKEEMEDSLKIQGMEEEKIDIWDCLSKIPEKYSYILRLYYEYDLDLKTIHQITHLPIGTIKSRLDKARKILRKEYLGEGLMG